MEIAAKKKIKNQDVFTECLIGWKNNYNRGREKYYMSTVKSFYGFNFQSFALLIERKKYSPFNNCKCTQTKEIVKALESSQKNLSPIFY